MKIEETQVITEYGKELRQKYNEDQEKIKERIYDMGLGACLGFGPGYLLRVPGGWVYNHQGMIADMTKISMCFIPYSEEYKIKELTKGK